MDKRERREERRDRPARILLVEDNPDDVELTRRSLGACSRPVELKVEERLDRARRWLEQDWPDLVVLDLNLPDSRGRATYDRVREWGYTGRVTILSGAEVVRDLPEAYSISKDDVRAETLGLMLQVLVAPEDIGEVLSRAVDEACEDCELNWSAGERE